MPSRAAWYYQLSMDDTLPDMMVCRPPRHIGDDVLLSTRPVTSWPADVRCVRIAGERAYDYVPALLPWEIVSAPVASVLWEMGKGDVECLPVVIEKGEGREEITGYSVLHVMREIQAFDREHGVWKENDLGLWVIKKALLGDVIAGLDVFRMAEVKTAIIVSKATVARLHAIGAVGFAWLSIPVY